MDNVLVKPGDIAAWGGAHVGIVTEVNLIENTIVTREGYNLDNMGGENTQEQKGKRQIIGNSPRILRVK